MADEIRQVDYFDVSVPDKPGEAFRLLSEIRKAGVNLLAFCAFPTTSGTAQMDFVPENPDTFREASSKLGWKIGERKRALLVRGEDRVGAVADIHEKLAREKINITAVQAVSGGNRYGLILWVKPADQDRARKALGA
jgi:hypothetical protein